MTLPSKNDNTTVVAVVPVPEYDTAGHEATSLYPSVPTSNTSTPYSSTTKLALAAPTCPDGGVVAWAQVLAGFLMNAVGWGYPATFGMYQLHYVSNLGLPGSQVAWVGSVQTFLAYALCVVAGRLADAGYIRSTVSVGSVFVVVGTLATSWAVKYWQILLAQGLCTGLGLGLITTPTLTVLTVIAQQVAQMSPTTCVALLMINSAVGIPIRPLSGMIADRFPRILGPVNMFAITTLLVGASLLAWIAASTSVDMYIFAVGFGVVNGASQSVWPGALISITPDPKRLGVRYGMLCVFAALATLVGPPIAAAIVDAAARGGGNGFMPAQAWAGALALVSGVIAFGARPNPLPKSEVDEKV
ncbi:hypothetical protein PpBr36_01690 [Pyricularia pennisetigena]|uniref:hypothetical protein n=1 Tax=Pyricularia pennisetigena TaxID=1578925 RepID=UPI00114FAF13|nr:hypothetical protein PpBr36_01690 [Pyricularia pennisetigena]TLS29223.1 hypothetical protein PpBr36_01690 [Pyricularia pennisetigena]